MGSVFFKKQINDYLNFYGHGYSSNNPVNSYLKNGLESKQKLKNAKANDAKRFKNRHFI